MSSSNWLAVGERVLTLSLCGESELGVAAAVSVGGGCCGRGVSIVLFAGALRDKISQLKSCPALADDDDDDDESDDADEDTSDDEESCDGEGVVWSDCCVFCCFVAIVARL